jgi:hypothetical protein
MKYSTNGAIVWDGPSRIDGSPIMAIITGLRTASANPKTGDMLQTWILRSDMHPLDAIKAGSDYAICGSCIHRGTYDEFGNPIDPRTCYVNPFSFGSVFKGFKRGIYPRVAPATLRPYLAGKPIRFGSYGDPAAVPARVWRSLRDGASGHTGYTHQWRRPALTMARTCSWRRAIMSATEPMQAPPAGGRSRWYRLMLRFRLAMYAALLRKKQGRRRLARIANYAPDRWPIGRIRRVRSPSTPTARLKSGMAPGRSN